MFGPPGHAYVYLVYGLHHCLNVVAGPDGQAGAVLVRAAAPVIGAQLMRARRGAAAGPDARLASGPARLCQALAVDRALDGHDLTRRSALWLADPVGGPPADLPVVSGRRVGVAYAGPGWADRPWRFGVRDHASLSRTFG
jgi:DNA-3-methyladenine glycosylase